MATTADDDDWKTDDEPPRQILETEVEQMAVEKTLRPLLSDEAKNLKRSEHISFILQSLGKISERLQSLDCSRPWFCYWLLQAADLLNATDDVFERYHPMRFAQLLSYTISVDDEPSCAFWEPCTDCGERACFSGGPGQVPHLASAYAAVASVVILKNEELLKKVDRQRIENWLVSLRTPDGAFRMHRSGETDIRATFCAAAITHLLQLDAERVLPLLCAEYVARCQTYEGGIAASNTGCEAHGGYTQCGLAAMLLMRRTHLLDLDNLARWCAMRQQQTEGGFCGRTNKLVDSCYSFWVGSSFAMVSIARALERFDAGVATSEDKYVLANAQLIDESEVGKEEGEEGGAAASSTSVKPDDFAGSYLFDQEALQRYVYQCCQNPVSGCGGLQDKPNAGCDFYHTCYSLSGVSIAQNDIYGNRTPRKAVFPPSTASNGGHVDPVAASGATSEVSESRKVRRLINRNNPILNVCRDKVSFAIRVLGKSGKAFL